MESNSVEVRVRDRGFNTGGEIKVLVVQPCYGSKGASCTLKIEHVETRVDDDGKDIVRGIRCEVSLNELKNAIKLIEGAEYQEEQDIERLDERIANLEADTAGLRRETQRDLDMRSGKAFSR